VSEAVPEIDYTEDTDFFWQPERPEGDGEPFVYDIDMLPDDIRGLHRRIQTEPDLRAKMAAQLAANDRANMEANGDCRDEEGDPKFNTLQSLIDSHSYALDIIAEAQEWPYDLTRPEHFEFARRQIEEPEEAE
jgi:hypothetical protein